MLLCMVSCLSTVLTYTVKTIRMAPYVIASCKTCFFQIPVFGRKIFLIFPIIYLTVDLMLICIFGLSDLVNPLILADIYPG